MKVCTICNRTYPDDAKVCENDGQRLIRVQRMAATDVGPALDWDGPLAGDIVGSYRLESLLAEGGMGRIFKATHLKLGRPVAIKFLLPEHAARADLVRRFFNEARSVNAINHPHIIDIIDFVETVDDDRALVYMVMEFLEGEDTRRRLRREGPYPPELVAHIGAQCAETLAAAHDAGILHRDLKPDNIFLCRSGRRDDFVKLLDFGAAKAFGDRHGHHLTRPGVAIGTPEYMSPEQITAQPMDGRVDAYGLGCVCYELLTGTVPFKSEKVAGILAKHTGERPIPPSRRRKVPPQVPEDLERVVLRCMEKRPDDRYPDLWEVSEAFHACLASARATGLASSVGARETGPPEREGLAQDTARDSTPAPAPMQAPAPSTPHDGATIESDELPFELAGAPEAPYEDNDAGHEFDDRTAQRLRPVEDAAAPSARPELDPMPRASSGAAAAPAAEHQDDNDSLMDAMQATSSQPVESDDDDLDDGWDPPPVRRGGHTGLWITLILALVAAAGAAAWFILR